MKRRLFALCIAFALLLPAAAYAASPDTANFTRTKTYSGQFADLTPDSRFYQNVAALYEYGLSVGKANGTFGIKDPIYVNQLIIFAARIRSLYETGDPESGAAAYRTGEQQVWEPYLLYLQKQQVLGNELDGLYTRAATRKVAAHVMVNTLPKAVLPEINRDVVTQGYASRKFIPDVTEYTEYSLDILTLYKMGISQGNDAWGAYLPEETITRGAFAALLTRMVDPALRITLTWDLAAAFSAKDTTWGSLIQGNPTYVAAPATQKQTAQAVNYMLSRETNVLTLRYPFTLSSQFVNQVMSQALAEVKRNCEQMYNSVTCSYDRLAGTITLHFSTAGATARELTQYREFTLQNAITVHDSLWESGKLNFGMTQYERAWVYFDWICANCVYDYNAGDTSLSHTAYGLFSGGTAVCDGYTGAYNLLLRLEGIDCYALSNTEHIWTVATLDGTQYHIDTTWGDSESGVPDASCFGMTEAQSRQLHTW